MEKAMERVVNNLKDIVSEQFAATKPADVVAAFRKLSPEQLQQPGPFGCATALKEHGVAWLVALNFAEDIRKTPKAKRAGLVADDKRFLAWVERRLKKEE